MPTDDKAVIVSQWPSMLLLIRKQLSQFDVKTEMFTGAVPVLLRNKIVGEFNNTKGGPKVNKFHYQNYILINLYNYCVYYVCLSYSFNFYFLS